MDTDGHRYGRLIFVRQDCRGRIGEGGAATRIWQRGVRWFCAGLLFAACLFHSFAGEPEVPSEFLIEKWQTEEGLPQNSVTTIVQDADGYLWMGTFNGLVRFDGHRFTVYDPSTTPALKSSRIVQLAKGPGDRVWIISEFQDAAVYGAGAFEPVRADPGGTPLRVAKAFPGADGSLFLQNTNRAIFQIFKGGETRLVYRFGSEDLGRMVALAASKEGVWVALKKLFGLARNGTFEKIETQSSELLLVEVIEPARNQDGVWTAGRHSGLSRYREAKRAAQFKFPKPGLIPTAIFEAADGRVWVGTLTDGVFIWDGKQWMNLSRKDGLSHNSIRCIVEDREGNYWIGTDGGGLNRLKRRLLGMIATGEGLPTEVVLAITADDKDRVWAGLNGYSGVVMDGKSLKRLILEPWLDANNSIWSMVQGRDGRVWTTDGYGGLIAFDASGRGRHFQNPAVNRRVYCRSMLQARDGAIYAGDINGLIKFKDGHFSDLSNTNGLQSDDVRAIVEDSEGVLYLGLNGGGVARWEKERWVFYDQKHGLRDNRVWSLHHDSDGDLWAGTFGSGLSRFRDGQFRDVSGPGGMPVKVVTSIIEDEAGALWIGSMQGIFQVSRKELNAFADGALPTLAYRKLDRTDGLTTTECNGGYQPAACKLRDGRICIATIKGIARIDPRSLRANPMPAAVLVEELLVDERPVPINASAQLAIGPGVERLEVRYTGISLSGPEKVRFKYRLEGFDKAWVDAGDRRVAYFSQVRPGKYLFKVQACNSDGIWNEQGAVLGLYVKPFIWQTAWFLTAVSLLGLGALSWMIWFVSLKQMRQKLALVQAQHTFEMERSRIAQDIHDDLGARLTQIGLLAELAKRQGGPEEAQQHLERITSETREVVQAMDEIVWAVDPAMDKVDNLADYVAAFTQEFLRISSVECRLDIPAVLPHAAISADARHNMALVLKEALNNAVKHAKANQVAVRLSASEGAIEIEVKDDGIGFDLSSPRLASGNGLANMRSRMDRINGQIDLESHPGQGTRVRFSVPLAGL